MLFYLGYTKVFTIFDIPSHSRYGYLLGTREGDSTSGCSESSGKPYPGLGLSQTRGQY
ncbi:hypothetical protein BDV30DRAFT_216405 [Aspergillus minisclerotigenes]|uniref:Uncharacterized protein n=1 Tax=Aspergillus minisclerotigenes TaxID=656917 RepID=A0A5N6ISS3_9EURO|nr:hypothetical protein BDV30DRAFT_216405 [Aspergillus minisclerotigenes]